MSIDLKPGDEFPFQPEVYLVTDVKPGFGKFDAILFADLVGAKPKQMEEEAKRDQRAT